MNKEPPAPQPHLWDGTPMAAMPYVISKGNDTPVHRVYQGMNMSKAEELANVLDDLYAVDERPIDKETSIELRRLSAINAELLEALEDTLQSLCWLAFGECRNVTSRPLLSALQAEEKSRAAIAKAQGEQP